LARAGSAIGGEKVREALSGSTPKRPKKGTAATPKFASAAPYLIPVVEPMEAKLANALPEGDGWQYEPKWDGFRCLAYAAPGQAQLYSKSGKRLDRYFPELAQCLANAAPQTCVLDGELIIAIDGNLSFEALQARLHPAESRIRRLSRATPARYALFDCLQAGGHALVEAPLVDRRAALAELIEAMAVEDVFLSNATEDLPTARRWLKDSGSDTDGVICKRLDEAYRPGERAMIKVKRRRTADCVVGGFRYASGETIVGSLLLGLYDEAGRLDHVGYTSALDREQREALTPRLEAMIAPPGFTGRAPGGPSRWSTDRSGDWQPVRPELVVEVLFDHVTGNRFRHGTRFLRWRPDKAVEQCRMEQIRP
jgi:ATP-dependent DNA ligase